MSVYINFRNAIGQKLDGHVKPSLLAGHTLEYTKFVVSVKTNKRIFRTFSPRVAKPF